jgi:integrase
MDDNARKMLSAHWREMISQKKPQWKKATLQSYNKTWNVVFSRYWGQHYPTEINPHYVLAFKSWYLTEFPSREPSKVKIHLKVFFDYLNAIGCLPEVPSLKPLSDLVKIVQKNARREKVGRALSKAESDRLIEAATFYPVEWASAVVLLALHTGMRKREILDSDKLRFSEKELSLEVWSQKNGKYRQLPLNWIREQPAEIFGSKILQFLKNSSTAAVYSSSAFQKHWDKIKADSGISGRLRFHDLRHTFATRSAEANWPPVHACDILDMSLAIYQKVYAKASLDSKRELFKKL